MDAMIGGWIFAVAIIVMLAQLPQPEYDGEGDTCENGGKFCPSEDHRPECKI